MPENNRNCSRERDFALQNPKVPKDRLKILFWNIWYHSDPNEVMQALKTFDCDAMFLFEVDESTGLPYLINENLGYGGKFVQTNSFGMVNAGIAFFSRIETGPVKLVTLSQGRRGIWRGGPESRRCYLEAGLVIPDSRPIIVGGTHLSFKLPFLGKEKYYKELHALSQETEKSDERFIFGGDLNAGPRSVIVKHLIKQELKHLTKQGASWPVRRYLRYVLPHRLLDHAFSTPNLGKATAEFVGGCRVSDHLPLIVTLRLP